mmetsp:Transcript_48038/g.109107  ORF Transcript_48038/g.109107 Transcript_48038/m.109107 type:complete len:326 (+) Transcript_48038:268-1245(+)
MKLSSMTLIAVLRSSSRTWSRKCIFAWASAMRMTLSMCLTATGTPPEVALSRRRSAYSCASFPSSIPCSCGRTCVRAYWMYFCRSSWLMVCSPWSFSIPLASPLPPPSPLASASASAALSSARFSLWLRWWEPITKLASASSAIGSIVSWRTQSTSNLWRMGSVSSTFSLSGTEESYTPPMGFAAAITAHLACSDVTMPAFDTLMDCCSMASWMEVRSCSDILSNSSIKHSPRSAKTSAPPSRVHSLVRGSFRTPAVSPTAEAPLPVVYTARGAIFSEYLRICDLAVPGSPRSSTLMSPRMRCLLFTFLGQPPKRAMATAIFTWS